MLVYLDFFKGYFLQSRYIYKSYRFLDPHFTPMGRAYVKSSPWIELVIVQIFIDKVNLYKGNLGLISSLWYSGNRDSAPHVLAASSTSNISLNNLLTTASTFTAGPFGASTVILGATLAAPRVSATLAVLTTQDVPTVFFNASFTTGAAPGASATLAAPTI